MQLQPFMPIGNTVILTTNGTASTANNTMVPWVPSAGLNIPSAQPNQIRMLNKGSADIWVSFTAASTAIAIPTAGANTGTIGTPTAATWLAPGIEITLTIPGPFALSGATATGYGFWLNNISTGVSQVFYFQLGEGV